MAERKKRAGINETSEILEISRYELYKGARTGKYPCYRIGGARGRIIFDIELLEKHIEKMMIDNTIQYEAVEETRLIRKVK